MNVWCVAGNLTKDPEIRMTQSSKKVASFTVAINEGKDKTEFVNCVAWEKTAELIEQYVKKGDRLSCNGKAQTRKWEKDGQTHYTTELIVDRFDFPPKRSGEWASSSEHLDPNQEGEVLPLTDTEDEIPF